MYQKLYGQMKDKENLRSILAEVREDLKKARKLISAEDTRVLEQHGQGRLPCTKLIARDRTVIDLIIHLQ